MWVTARPRPLQQKLAIVLGATTTLMLCGGCPGYRDANVPNPILRQRLPDGGSSYRLYVPTTYDRNYKHPLIIACHGTRPWDSPRRQMLDWVKLSEERGFIVAAPSLTGTSSWPLPSATSQIARQREDERRILGVVRRLKGAYNISEDRVFLTGWSAGNFAVLYTGLKNPQIFRALALQQGNFDPAFLSDVVENIDREQPISVIYGSSDLLTGEQTHECVKWLEDQHANVSELEVPGGHRGHPTQAVSFFERVLRIQPWLHIRTFGVDNADPLTARFKIRASFAPTRYQWSFGDGSESPVAEPIHRFPQTGTYRVTLTVWPPKGKPVTRAVDLAIPQLRGQFAERSTFDPPAKP